MQQWMPEHQGWVDHGPRRKERHDAGPVRITRRPDHEDVRDGRYAPSFELVPAYTPTELRLVIKRGQEDPRELSPSEQAIAFRNQVRADADLAHMEKWARDGFCVPEGDR